jgi:hypothetical protein
MGVIETLKAISKMVLRELKQSMATSGTATPEEASS